MRGLIAAGIIINFSRAPECYRREYEGLVPGSCLWEADVVFEGRAESMQIRAHSLFEDMTAIAGFRPEPVHRRECPACKGRLPALPG